MDKDRKNALLDAGAALASKHGASNVTRRMVAKAAKVSDGLVAHYLGPAADAQKKYKARAKKLGLPLPDKDQEAAMGVKLRAKKQPKRAAPAKKSAGGGAKRAAATSAKRPATTAAKPARKRSVAEVKAIKDKAAGKRSAARKPKAPPTAPPLPLPELPPPLPTLN